MRTYYVMLSTIGIVCITVGSVGVVLGPVLAEQPLDSLIAAERIYEDYPAPKTLPAEELAVLIEVWDEAVVNNDLRTIIESLHRIERSVPRGYNLGRARVLRYDNPEIHERVIAQYVSEMDMRAYMSETGLTRADFGLLNESLDHEVYPNYLDALATLALSTFSPEIYDTVLKWSYGGWMHDVYLASVNPETTLRLILETNLGVRDGVAMNSDTFYHVNPDVSFGDIRSVLDLLSVLCRRSPEVVLRNEGSVVDFIREHSTYYATPRKVGSKDERYLWRQDHDVRRLALKSLELLAQSADVYTIVDDIMRDPPDNPASPHSANEITTLGTRLIEQIQALR